MNNFAHAFMRSVVPDSVINSYGYDVGNVPEDAMRRIQRQYLVNQLVLHPPKAVSTGAPTSTDASVAPIQPNASLTIPSFGMNPSGASTHLFASDDAQNHHPATGPMTIPSKPLIDLFSPQSQTNNQNLVRQLLGIR